MYIFRITARCLLGSLLLLLVLTIPEASAQTQIAFNEVSVAAGVGSDSYDSLTRHGLGLNWIDYDNDGFPDLFVPNGAGLSAHLFHNEGDGTFTNQDDLLPITTAEMTGAVFADYDNDGDMDIYITAAGDILQEPDGGANLLFHNLWEENGQQIISGTPLFDERAATAGIDNLPATPFGAEPGYMSFTAGWVDYNRDSCIDLFVGTMVWDDGGMETTANTFYENNCDGTFTDITAASGINPGGDLSLYRPTLAFFAGLLDPSDLDPDLYVINVHDGDPYHIDQLFSNNGDGTFTDIVPTMPGIGDDSGAGMGIDVADIDHDGDWDIYMSDLQDPGNEPIAEGNPFYLGNADGTWNENSAPAAGIESKNSWGVNFADFDQDGYEDLHVGVISSNGNDMLFENDGDGTFTDISVDAGIIAGGEARGSAVADYDRDGDLDFAVVNIAGTLLLYENVSTNQGNWLALDLEAVSSNRAAIGALIEVTAGGTTYMRQVKGGSSAHSQDDLRVHFGLGDNTTADEVKVSWPSGIVQTLTAVSTNQVLTVTEDGSCPAPTATFSSTTTDLSVDFDGSASFAGCPERSITDYSWDFGDGNSTTGATPTHAYAAAGTYTVILTVTDSEGETDTDTQSVTVSDGNAAPTAAFSFTATDLTVDFTDASTDDGVISSWSWDFGDGNTSTSQSPSHSYLADGTYTVSLTVTDDGGLTDTDTQDVTVSTGGSSGTGAFLETGGLLVFEAENYVSMIERDGHSWIESMDQAGFSGATAMKSDPDNGTRVRSDPETTSPELITDVHFTTTGTYYVWHRLWATDGRANKTYAGIDGVAADDPLIISTFGEWVWANTTTAGNVSTLEVATAGDATAHVWMGEDGVYVDKVIMTTDPDFVPTGEGPDESPRDSAGPTASFTYDATGLSVIFTDTSTDDGSVVSWSWDFGDGNASTDQNPTHEYTADGTYTVMLTVTDDEGNEGTTSQDIFVGNQAPTASFTFSQVAGTFEVSFDATGSTDDDTITAWDWDFGDGATGAGETISYTYVATGTYSVMLTVTDNEGATGSITESVTVVDESATGAFIESAGLVVMEAENFHANIDRSGDSWALETANAGFSGAGYMATTPDDGTQIQNDVETTSPELSFDVEFTTTGDYHVWGRIWAPNAKGNTVYVGTDGAIIAGANGFQTTTYSEWVWTELSKGGSSVTANVDAAGLHTVHLWMREDGITVDKILFSTDSNFIPEGEGPAESPRGSAAPQTAAATLSDPGSKGQSTIDIPTEFALEGNYPNPFNPATTIQVAVPEASVVRLEVYDILGQHVATLVDGELTAGRHQVRWVATGPSGNQLASGIYLVRMQAGSFIGLQKVLLVK